MNYSDAVVSLFYSDLYFRVYILISIMFFVAFIVEKVLWRIALRKREKELRSYVYKFGGMRTFGKYCSFEQTVQNEQCSSREFFENEDMLE